MIYHTVGFTGSRLGMTHKQIAEVTKRLEEYKPNYVRHGDCLGADAQFHDLCLIHVNWCNIIIHPPTNTKMRAYCMGSYVTVEPKPYLVRNKHIVMGSHILIACPPTEVEEFRSGTWSTIRYAEKTGIEIIIIFP